MDGLTPETKTAKISYDPGKITVHELAQAVADTAGLHGEPYEASLVVTIVSLAKNGTKVQAALRQVKGLGVPKPLKESTGDIAIPFLPLKKQAKASDFVKASQIAEVLKKAGVEFSGLDLSTPAGGGFKETDAKTKLPAAKGSAKTKGGSDDMPAGKTKPARPAGGSSKGKSAREPLPHSKAKDAAPDDTPRFQILVSGDKVYLIDHQAKLKKFVKLGDKFGDFEVKELADEDSWFVVLEDPKTGETVRVEERKEKDKDKPREPKGKVSKEKDSGDKKNKDEEKD